MTKRRCRNVLASHSGVLGVALCLLGACGLKASNNDISTGSAEAVAMALDSQDAASVVVTVSGQGIASPIVVSLVRAGNMWTGTIGGIPSGTARVFTLSVRDAAGIEIYRGEATGVAITPGQVAAVLITAQQTSPSIPNHNAAPVIDSFVASAATVAPGEVVGLTVLAHDPNPGDLLSYNWTAADGAFGSPNAAMTTWTAPQGAGTYRVSVQVRDQKNAKASMSVSITVDANHGRGKAAISVGMNTWPVVVEVTADPGRVDIGEATVVAVRASDADGDTLAYEWSSDCTGTFSAASATSTSFTLAGVPTNNACTFTVLVQDGKGGSNSGSLTVFAGPQPPVDLPPAIVSTYQSTESAAPGEPVTFRIQAADPNSTELSFAWTATQGVLGAPRTLGGTSEVVWTAPPTFVAGAEIEVIITDATAQATVQAFAVQPKVPTWKWVSGPSLAANSVLDKCWAAPGNEVYVAAMLKVASGTIPESWLYHFESGVWTEVLHLTDATISRTPVFATSPSDVFFSVYRCPNGWGQCGAGEGPAIWHFDGAVWSQMDIPDIGLNWIQSIQGVRNNIYASYGAGILRYDGASWSVVASGGSIGWGPLAYLGENEIYSLACWGYSVWDGSAWRIYPGFDFCDVDGVFGVRAQNGMLSLWAEGNNNFSNGIRAWRFVEGPVGSMTGSWGAKYDTFINDVQGYGSGSGIWASGPSDFWVVGAINNHTEGRIWRWDGASWSRQLALSTLSSAASCVWGTSPSDVWVTLRDGRLLHYAY